MVKADWVKPGAVVLDVGINVEEDDDGKSHVLGDVAFAEVSQVAGQPLAKLGPSHIIEHTFSCAELYAGAA